MKPYAYAPEESWKDLVARARVALNAERWADAVDAINSIDVAQLPKVAPLDDLPYHVLSIFLSQLPYTSSGWLIDKISLALIKWLVNQGRETCGGMPYFGRHIVKFAISDLERLQIYLSVVERAARLFGHNQEMSTAEVSILCNTQDSNRAEWVDRLLDMHFMNFTGEQRNFIFTMWNAHAIAWARRRAIQFIDKDVSEDCVFNALVLIAAYGTTGMFDLAVKIVRQRIFRDPAINAAVDQICHGREISLDRLARSRSVRSERKLRVALCVSGQLRGFRTARQTWSALGLDDHEIHTFVHVWAEVGRKLPAPGHSLRLFPRAFSDAFSRHMMRIGTDEFWSRYPTFRSLYEQKDIVSAEDIKSFYNTDAAVVESQTEGIFLDSNSARMHYKIQACNELIHKSGVDFDLVVRIRPDKTFHHTEKLIDWPEHLKALLIEKFILVDDFPVFLPAGGYGFGDQIAIGCQYDMDRYARTFALQSSNMGGSGLYGFPADHFPHTSLAFSCFYDGVLARSLREIVPTIGEPVDAEPIAMRTIVEAVMHDSLLRGFGHDEIDRDLIDAANLTNSVS